MNVVMLCVGILIGFVVRIVFTRFRKVDGTLLIDTRNPEKDIYRLDIEDLDSLGNKKQIIIKVDASANLSQY